MKLDNTFSMNCSINCLVTNAKHISVATNGSKARRCGRRRCGGRYEIGFDVLALGTPFQDLHDFFNLCFDRNVNKLNTDLNKVVNTADYAVKIYNMNRVQLYIVCHHCLVRNPLSAQYASTSTSTSGTSGTSAAIKTNSNEADILNREVNCVIYAANIINEDCGTHFSCVRSYRRTVERVVNYHQYILLTYYSTPQCLKFIIILKYTFIQIQIYFQVCLLSHH